MDFKDNTPTLISVPSPYAPELVEKLLPYAVVRQYSAHKKLVISSPSAHFCVLITRGRFQLQRESDDIVINFLKGPCILGLVNLTDMNIGAYLKTLTPCEIGMLPSDDLLKYIDAENLWKTLSQHLLLLSGKLTQVSQQFVASRMYDIVRTQLLEYISEDEALRNEMTIENYIRSKTNLSRSGIMKILKSLKTGGHIESVRGKSLKINSLPKRY
jgi:CRP-like cAMP-binding protein